MAITLEKGQRINLEKNNGSKLENFCVGCNWGMIETYKREEVVVNEGFLGIGRKTEYRNVKHKENVDLDLSCIMIDESGNICDHIYSPLYKPEFLAKYGFPKGKFESSDYAFYHSPDDLEGDEGGDDGLDNEIISVDLRKVSSKISQIFFFLNNCGEKDFSQIPYATIRMYEGSFKKINEVFAKYDVSAEEEYKGKLALIMGKLYRKNGDWKFAAIGDAFDDKNLCLTINRIKNDYAK